MKCMKKWTNNMYDENKIIYQINKEIHLWIKHDHSPFQKKLNKNTKYIECNVIYRFIAKYKEIIQFIKLS